MSFIDEVRIHLKAGDGGNGLASFRREKFIEYGGPNGGDGGKGGDVILRAVPNINTLVDFRFNQNFGAKNGERGGTYNCSGKSGEDLIILVPVGTQIFMDDGYTLLADLDLPGQEMVLLQGGRGGLGNTHFKSSTNRAPRKSTDGREGPEMFVWLKLKLLSDVGIIGEPNAGKSTFLSIVSAAKPKIADYPFTTLRPQLGVAQVAGEELVIADIPGLIEGASEGRGLGHRFLKHVERCPVLLHMIDATVEDVVKQYDKVRKELWLYQQKNKIQAVSNLQELIISASAALKAEKKQAKAELEAQELNGWQMIDLSREYEDPEGDEEEFDGDDEQGDQETTAGDYWEQHSAEDHADAKVEIIALNKCELVDEMELQLKQRTLESYLLERTGVKPQVICCSGATYQGVPQILRILLEVKKSKLGNS